MGRLNHDGTTTRKATIKKWALKKRGEKTSGETFAKLAFESSSRVQELGELVSIHDVIAAKAKINTCGVQLEESRSACR